MSLQIVSARSENLGIKIRCPYCKFHQRVNVSFVEDAIMENGVIVCVACDRVFKIIPVSLTRAAQLRDEADGEGAEVEHKDLRTEDSVVTRGEMCPYCNGNRVRNNGNEVYLKCSRCNGTGRI